MANVIENEEEVSVERQAQLMPSRCNWGWGNYAAEGAYVAKSLKLKELFK